MKVLFSFLFMATLLFSCNSSTQTDNKAAVGEEKSIAPEDLLNIKFDVRGMTCEGCENTIKKSVGELPGVVEVSASHTDSMAIVKFDKTLTTIEDITSTINSKGYKVEGYEIEME